MAFGFKRSLSTSKVEAAPIAAALTATSTEEVAPPAPVSVPVPVATEEAVVPPVAIEETPVNTKSTSDEPKKSKRKSFMAALFTPKEKVAAAAPVAEEDSATTEGVPVAPVAEAAPVVEATPVAEENNTIPAEEVATSDPVADTIPVSVTPHSTFAQEQLQTLTRLVRKISTSVKARAHLRKVKKEDAPITEEKIALPVEESPAVEVPVPIIVPDVAAPVEAEITVPPIAAAPEIDATPAVVPAAEIPVATAPVVPVVPAITA